MAARNSGFVRRTITLLVIPSLLTTGAGARCELAGQVEFLHPSTGLTLQYLDRIHVEYRSNIQNPILSCWCDSGIATQQFATPSPSFNASDSVVLNFVSSGPCWFELAKGTGACEGRSSNFTLVSSTRSPGELRRDVTTTPASIVATTTSSSSSSSSSSLDSTATSSRTTSFTSSASTANAAASPGDSGSDGGASLSPGAEAGLAIAIALAGIVTGAMVAFYYFRRRKRVQESELAGAIVNHEGRNSRRGFEKWITRQDSSSTNSARGLRSVRSQEPIVEAVFDGFPGSTGYDDVRSLHSEWSQSPSSTNPGEWYDRERSRTRDELTAARLNSGPLRVSYGPNPLTPTLNPRSGARVAGIARQDSWRSDVISTDSRENVPPMPPVPAVPSVPSLHTMPSYASFPGYDYTPPAPAPPPPKPAAPIIVSYGPNRVTPTPAVKSPTVPPDESVLRMKGMTSQNPRPITSHDRQFSFEADDDFIYGLGLRGVDAVNVPAENGPLPPYASSAEFEAMEKGAIKKMEQPQAAELPPTKDGYYHFGVDEADIYELAEPSAAQHQQPFRTGPGGGMHDIDEQKILLPDNEIALWREQKAKIRAMQQEQRQREMEGEAYEMTSGPSSAPSHERW